MDLQEYFKLVFSDYTLRTITIGTAILGTICGMLGSFAVLRKQSLLGDAISHASLPGIAIVFLITGTKDTNVLLFGALISGLLGALWIRGIVKKYPFKNGYGFRAYSFCFLWVWNVTFNIHTKNAKCKSIRIR